MANTELVYRLARAQLLDMLDYTAPGLGEIDWRAEIVLDNWLDGRAITPEPNEPGDAVRAAAERAAADQAPYIAERLALPVPPGYGPSWRVDLVRSEATNAAMAQGSYKQFREAFCAEVLRLLGEVRV